MVKVNKNLWNITAQQVGWGSLESSLFSLEDKAVPLPVKPSAEPALRDCPCN